MSQILYLRSAAGEACGPGDNESLSTTTGTSSTTKVIETEHTWNIAETERSVSSGTWFLNVYLTTGDDGSPTANRVRIIVERRNSSCVVQETIFNIPTSDLANNSTCISVTIAIASVPQIDFTAGNILTIRMVRDQGPRSQSLCYDGNTTGDGGDQARITFPDSTSSSSSSQSSSSSSQSSSSSSTSSSSSQSSSSSSASIALTTMTKFYVATSGGSNNNDGGDVLGLDLSASWTASNKRLTQTEAFTSYTFTSGDFVFLSHASITDDIYTIAQKIDNNTIELVDSINGSNLTSVRSSNGPFATMTQAGTQVAAGDMVFLCTITDGEKFNNEPSYPVTLNTRGNTTSGLIQWSGANSSGIADGTMAIVSNPSAGDVIQLNANGDDQYFQYISAEDGTRGWDLQNPLFLIFWRCEARNNTEAGWSFNAQSNLCIECLSEKNGTRGFFAATNDTAFINCVAKNNNTEAGFDGASDLTHNNAERSVIFGCLSYNDGTGSQDNGFRRQSIIANCVAYNNTQDGVELASTHIGRGHIIIDSLFIENGAWGISDAGAGGLFLNNAFYSNTSGEMETNPVTEGIELNSVTLPTNPFQDVANNDFTLNRDRAGLLSRREIHQGDWIKKPANLVLNSDFNNDDNWTVQGNWTIANGVAHHSTGDTSVLDYDANIITDGVEYETIFTVLNYVSGSVNITLGSTNGTSRSADGTFREIITGGNPTPESSEQTLAITPTSDFVGNIDDVLVAPIHSGPQGNRGSGGGRMKSHGARGVARPKDRRIKVG